MQANLRWLFAAAPFKIKPVRSFQTGVTKETMHVKLIDKIWVLFAAQEGLIFEKVRMTKRRKDSQMPKSILKKGRCRIRSAHFGRINRWVNYPSRIRFQYDDRKKSRQLVLDAQRGIVVTGSDEDLTDAV